MMVGCILDNQALCDTFGVANTGGIRVNKRRSLIVLISNSTGATYKNEWREGVLHFVDVGAGGPQKLDRQNTTLANSKRRGWTLHLFEAREKSKYVYTGEVELADEPYCDEQPDAKARERFVWIFPLRRKPDTGDGGNPPLSGYLPHGSYAVIDAELSDEQRTVVNDSIDRLRAVGVQIVDRRQLDMERFARELTEWQEAVLARIRANVKKMVADRRRIAAASGRAFKIVDDELRVDAGSDEAQLRMALVMLDQKETKFAELFEEATAAIPMPAAPESRTEHNESSELDVRNDDNRQYGRDFT
jgi:hypothetical protein